MFNVDVPVMTDLSVSTYVQESRLALRPLVVYFFAVSAAFNPWYFGDFFPPNSDSISLNLT